MSSTKSYQHAIRLLTIKDYSRHKLREKLLQGKHEEHEVEETLNLLTEMKYLKEEEFTQSRIRVLARKGKGAAFIKQQCEKEHLTVDKDLIKNVLESANIDLEQTRDVLIEKKVRLMGPIPSDYKEKQKYLAKLIRYLAGKGHQLPRNWERFMEIEENSYN